MPGWRLFRLQDRAPLAASLGVLALLVTLAYGDCLKNGFVFDDKTMIVQNPLITRLGNIPRFFALDYWAGRRAQSELSWSTGLYRPLALASYAINYAAGGLNPFGYHLVNLLLHLLVSWMVFAVGRGIGLEPTPAMFAAALFSVHPLNSEAVTSIVGRAELLMTAGVLGSLWFFGKGRQGLSLLAFAFGLFSKEQAVVLPVVLVLYDLCVGDALRQTKGPNGRLWLLLRRYGPFFLVLAGYLWARTLVLGGLKLPPIPFLDNPLAQAGWYLRLLSAIKVAGLYLGLFVWPASLSADYSYNAISLAHSATEARVLLALLAWGGLFGLVAWLFKRDRTPCFCFGLTALTFLPVSNLLLPIGTIMGERLFYLPSAGLCLMMGSGWKRIGYRWGRTERKKKSGRAPLETNGSRRLRIVGLILSVIICLAFVARTAVRNQDWSSEEALFLSAARAVPGSAKVHAVLGDIAKDRGELEPALQQYRVAMEIYPEYSAIVVNFILNLGEVYLRQGRLTEALQTFERADPNYSVTQFNLGLVYAQQKRYPEAEAAIRKAIALNSGFTEAYNMLSSILLESGNYEDALAQADAALQRRSDFPEAHYNRARALEKVGRLNEAYQEYRLAGTGQRMLGISDVYPTK